MSADEYEALLARYDWSHEHSDDHTAWVRGHKHRLALELYRYEFDRDFTIWNSYAPIEYKR